MKEFMGDPMKTAAVSELKARLSEFLGQVKVGNEVLITDRGKPVARLVPVGTHVKARKETLTIMEKQGLIRLGSSRLPKGFWGMQRGEDPGGVVLHALLEEREEGR